MREPLKDRIRLEHIAVAYVDHHLRFAQRLHSSTFVATLTMDDLFQS